MGTLWSSIKQIKAPYVSNWEHGIALHAIQGNCESSLADGEVSWFFLNCGGNLGCVFELRPGWTCNTRVSSVTSALLSS